MVMEGFPVSGYDMLRQTVDLRHQEHACQHPLRKGSDLCRTPRAVFGISIMQKLHQRRHAVCTPADKGFIQIIKYFIYVD